MYETMKKESLSRQPRQHHARTPADRKPSRKPPMGVRGEADEQIIEMERTFTDRWEW